MYFGSNNGIDGSLKIAVVLMTIGFWSAGIGIMALSIWVFKHLSWSW